MLHKSLAFHRFYLAGVLVLIALAVGPGCQPNESDEKPPVSGDTSASGPRTDLGGTDFNVLLVSVDTTRADYLACYGHPKVKTPNIDRLAAEGTRFAQCIASAPLTLPSHSTMLTGSYPFVHGARDNGIFTLAGENVTLAEIFKKAGYATHAEVAAMVLDQKYGLGQGFDSYGDVERPARPPAKFMSLAKTRGDAALKSTTDADVEPALPQIELDRKADDITRRGIELLTAQAESGERFFMFLHYFDPHWPHEAPERFTSQYVESYLAEIAFFDEQFGLLIDAVRDLGLAEKTLVIFTADHGEGRGEHGEQTHSVFLYDSTLHVPLIVWCPGQVPAGQVVQSQVRLIDIASTVVDFTGLESTEQMQGTSLLPLIANPNTRLSLPCYSDTLVPQHSLDYSPLRSLRADGWKYVLAPRPELYNLSEDQKELFNLAKLEPERAARMKEQLRAIIADSPSPAAGRGAMRSLNEEETRKLAALGYVSSQAIKNSDLRSGSELDHFEPQGVNPRDRVEVVECWACGLGAFSHGEYELAEKFYQRFVELEPDLAPGVSYYARCLMMLERDDEAIPMFRRAVELDPENFNDLRSLANLLSTRREYDEAIPYYRAVIQLNPEEVLGRLNLGNVFAAQRRYRLALEQYEDGLQFGPENVRLHLQKGVVLRSMRRFDESIAILQDVLRTDPQLERAYDQLAIALRQSGKMDEAIEQLQQAVDALPEAAVLHHRLGAFYTANGDVESAGKSFARVVELLPDSPTAHQNLGTNFLVRGEHRQAIEPLRRALELKPEFPLAQHHLAAALAATGDVAQAQETYRQLLETTPIYGPGYLPAASLLIDRGAETAAVQLLRQGHEALPNQADIANALAWYLATSSDPKLRDGNEAVQLIEPLIESRKDAAFLDTLAAAYAEAGRFEDAVATADRAVQVAEAAGETELLSSIRSRRELYGQQRAFHEGQ